MISPLHIPWWTSKNRPQELTANGLLKFTCLKAFLVHYQNYDQFIGSQLSVSSDRFIKRYPTQLLNVTVKINLILKCRFLCIRRYLIVVIFLNCFFSFKLFFIVVKGTVKFNIYRRFINLFKKIEMVMHHVSFFLFLLCAILLIYTMGHKTRNWKTNLESGYLRWTCIFSLTFMTTLHLQSRYIARISFLIYIKVNFYYKSW